MCLTAPVRVISVEGDSAVVDAGGIQRRASTFVVGHVQPGDWALMTAGTLARLVDPRTAAELAEAFRMATDGDA